MFGYLLDEPKKQRTTHKVWTVFKPSSPLCELSQVRRVERLRSGKQSCWRVAFGEVHADSGLICPITSGGCDAIWSAISLRLISTSRGKSKAIRTRSPLTEAIRTTPIGLRGSPITTSSPSRRVMTNIFAPILGNGPYRPTLSHQRQGSIEIGQACSARSANAKRSINRPLSATTVYHDVQALGIPVSADSC